MQTAYLVPAKSLEIETEVKKSRFIARLYHVVTRDEAKQFVEQAMQDHADARHVCWAYLLGNPQSASSAAMSDAGEPSGTAGRPILNVIQHKGIGDVMVIVIRYFGGIKLGAGGLVRAYSGAAEAVLSQAEFTQKKPMLPCMLTMSFAEEQFVRHWLATHEAILETVDYHDGVSMEVSLSPDLREQLQEVCAAHGIEAEFR